MIRYRLRRVPFGTQVQAERRAMSSIAYIRVFEGADGQWYYTPRGGNHETLSTSEGYTEKASAVRAVEDAYPGVEVKFAGDE